MREIYYLPYYVLDSALAYYLKNCAFLEFDPLNLRQMR